jgi:hypothetical protein
VVVLDAAVVVVTAATHALFVMVFVSNVTAPFRASNWPVIRAPVVAVMLVSA